MFADPYPEDFLALHVEREFEAFKEAGVDGVVVASNPPIVWIGLEKLFGIYV